MNVGLVLSGAMGKGAYQIGALRAISEFVPLSDIKCISSSSAGALNGYGYITGRLDSVEKAWKNICSGETRLIITKVLRSSMLQMQINDLCSPNIKLPLPFYCTLYDVTNNNVVYKNLSRLGGSEISTYLKAGVAMPVINHAVKVNGVSYYDGGLIDNIPVRPMLNKNLDYVICVYFDNTSYKFENGDFDKKIIKVSFPEEKTLKHSLIFKQEDIEKMISDGYDRTVYILNSVFAKGYENKEYAYKAIRHINSVGGNSTFRLTVDVIATNLNKVTQYFARRNIIK